MRRVYKSGIPYLTPREKASKDPYVIALSEKLCDLSKEIKTLKKWRGDQATSLPNGITYQMITAINTATKKMSDFPRIQKRLEMVFDILKRDFENERSLQKD